MIIAYRTTDKIDQVYKILIEKQEYIYEILGEKYYEFHVNTHDLFLTLTSLNLLGRYISIRRAPLSKIKLIFRQNESIFVPHSLNKIMWSINGIFPLQLKTQG